MVTKRLNLRLLVLLLPKQRSWVVVLVIVSSSIFLNICCNYFSLRLMIGLIHDLTFTLLIACALSAQHYLLIYQYKSQLGINKVS